MSLILVSNNIPKGKHCALCGSSENVQYKVSTRDENENPCVLNCCRICISDIFNKEDSENELCEDCEYYDTDIDDQPCCSCIVGNNFEEAKHK